MTTAEAKINLRLAAERCDAELLGVVQKHIIPSLVSAGLAGFLSSRSTKLPDLAVSAVQMGLRFLNRRRTSATPPPTEPPPDTRQR